LDKAITTTFMVIVSVILAVMVFNAVYPAVIQSSDAMINMKSRVDERLKSQIEIIHATGNGIYAFVWVKNIGSLRIAAIERSDVFFGPETNFDRILHDDETPDTPYWTYEVEGSGSEWVPRATLMITVTNSSSLIDGTRYFVKVVAPNGVSDEYYFSK